jgi:flagellar basal body-associated protein FliL
MRTNGWNGWAIALISVVIIILIILVLIAIFGASSSYATENNSTQNGNERGTRKRQASDFFNKLNQKISDWSDLTSDFVQQARSGYRGIGVTYKEMNKLADQIGDLVGEVKETSLGNEIGELFREKNEIFKSIIEDVLINLEALEPENDLLRALNENSVNLAQLFNKVCGENSRSDYTKVLHEYNMAVVQQIRTLQEEDYEKYLDYSKLAQQKALELAIAITVCGDS